MSLSVVSWFAHTVIANEIKWTEPLPASVRDEIAAEMVRDQDRLGWPDLEAAQATLDEWTWA